MGGTNSNSKQDEGKLSHALINKYLINQRHTFCLEKCIGENLSGPLSSDEEVCLAICVDKLHRRYNQHKDELVKTFTAKDAFFNKLN
jgi:hypothetical protein